MRLAFAAISSLLMW